MSPRAGEEQNLEDVKMAFFKIIEAFKVCMNVCMHTSWKEGGGGWGEQDGAGLEREVYWLSLSGFFDIY